MPSTNYNSDNDNDDDHSEVEDEISTITMQVTDVQTTPRNYVKCHTNIVMMHNKPYIISIVIVLAIFMLVLVFVFSFCSFKHKYCKACRRKMKTSPVPSMNSIEIENLGPTYEIYY